MRDKVQDSNNLAITDQYGLPSCSENEKEEPEERESLGQKNKLGDEWNTSPFTARLSGEAIDVRVLLGGGRPKTEAQRGKKRIGRGKRKGALSARGKKGGEYLLQTKRHNRAPVRRRKSMFKRAKKNCTRSHGETGVPGAIPRA